MDRRSFLKFTGAGLTLAALPKAVASTLPNIVPPKAASVLPVDPAAAAVGQITLENGHITCAMPFEGEGVTLQDLYTWAKETWKDDLELLQWPFPIMAITPEYMEMQSGWTMRPDAYNNIQKGSLRLDDNTWLIGMVSLGPEVEAFGGAIARQDFFARVRDDIQPLGKYPFNQGIIVDRDAPLSELEIIDAKRRVWATAENFGIRDEWRQGPIYYPIFAPNGYHLDFLEDGTQGFVDQVTFWMNRGNTEAEAYAMVWPDKYEMPPQQAWGKYSGPPIKRRLM